MIHSFIFLALGITYHSFGQTDSIIKWTAGRKLKYEDFMGSRLNQEINHDDFDTVAMLDCSIRYDISTKDNKWVIHAYAYVNPKKSWMDRQNLYVLKHEQGHFDIAEIFAKRFEKKVNDTVIADTHDFFVFANETLNETLISLNEEDHKYDIMTMNTLGNDYYYKWIDEQLSDQPK